MAANQTTLFYISVHKNSNIKQPYLIREVYFFYPDFDIRFLFLAY